MTSLTHSIFILSLAACLAAASAFVLLKRIRTGSLLSVGLALLLSKLALLQGFSVLNHTPVPAPQPAGFQKLSNHIILSLDIAAEFNSLILLMCRAIQTPEALAA